MIHLDVRLYPDGCLAGFSASGHAGAGAGGEGIVCAAATALLRTAARLLAGQNELKVDGSSPQPGAMFLCLQDPPAGRREWVRGVTDTLLAGLADLERENPGRLGLTIHEVTIGEDRYGT